MKIFKIFNPESWTLILIFRALWKLGIQDWEIVEPCDEQLHSFFFAEEEIYADLGLVRRGTNHDHNRSVHSAAARLSDWRFEPKEKRDFVLVELLETEANYGQAHDMFSRIF